MEHAYHKFIDKRTVLVRAFIVLKRQHDHGTTALVRKTFN